jgi:hypothetical protein
MKTVKIAMLLALALSMIVPISGNWPATDVAGIVFTDYEPDMNISAASHFSFIGNFSSQTVGDVISRNNGDLNGDGYDDLVIGYPFDNYDLRGRVQILFGGEDMEERPDNSTVADVIIRGEMDYSHMGSLVSILGDVNGDGIDDLGMVAEGYHDSYYGRFYLFLGRSEWNYSYSGDEADGIVSGDNTAMSWGDSIEGVGDINGDGLDDIAIGDGFSSGSNPFCGKVFILFGRTGAWPDGGAVSGECDASYEGFSSYQYLGYDVCGPGDINGDGYADLATSSYANDTYTGAVYIVFGRASGWSKDVLISDCNVVICGEGPFDYFGVTFSGNGDLNADGLNDLVVSATGSDQGASGGGKVYVFNGRQTWPGCIDAGSAYLQIVGEVSNRALGYRVLIVPDINADGLADLLIGSSYYDCGALTYCGVVHLYYGDASLQGSLDASDSDASFIGESSSDFLGDQIGIVGDLTGHGYQQVALTSPWNDEGASGAGKIYILGNGRNNDPLDISSMLVYSDPDYSKIASVIDIGETAYIEVKGIDGNSTTRDIVFINMTANMSHSIPLKVSLMETGTNTGIYRGKYTVRQFCYGETMSLVPQLDPSKTFILKVDTPVRLSFLETAYQIEEDQELSMAVKNLGYCKDPVWEFQVDADWLEFDPGTGRIHGAPDNGDVGSYKANITIKGYERTDIKAFSVKVKNIAPSIMTPNAPCAEEDALYRIDYASTEDGEPGIAWKLSTDAMWLRIDPLTGVLSGTPTNDDLGTYYVEVMVDDGNKGIDKSAFNLTVVNTNDAPVIATDDITTVNQGTKYIRTYSATDPDQDDTLAWVLFSDASWLSIDGSTISGTPGPYDVGIFTVNVSVADASGALDSHEFALQVQNVNDAPSFTSFPTDSEVTSGSVFTWRINATDPDGDALTYSVKTVPLTAMTIDKDGNIRWTVTNDVFSEDANSLLVQITASDGSLKTTNSFRLAVIMTLPPISTLSSPEDQTRIRSSGSSLVWSGSDPEGSPLTYDVYLSQDMASVMSLKESARYVKAYSGTNLPLTNLDAGKKYYWTVIPHDGGRYGTCSSGARSFVVNNPPTVLTPDIPECRVGSEFKLRIVARDLDTADGTALRYSLVTGPEGMTVGSSTGSIRWTPRADQAMLYSVVVNVTDGIEQGSCTFVLEVQKAEEAGGNSLILLLVGAISLIIVIGVGVAFFVIKKRSRAEEVDEETVIGAPDEIALPKIDCAVSTTIMEAHASEHVDHAPKSYEELYGVKPPTKEEALTTVELRDYIKKEIENIEEM